ncbi:MAG: polyribonucleotide nucleotidyltransferase [bacterium]
MLKKVQAEINGKVLTLETGYLAKQSNASVIAQCEGTTILATCVMAKKEIENIDFLPLTTEYRERSYAAGKIPGGFFKREGRPRDKEILISRLIDRPIRPLIPQHIRNEIQNIVTVLSVDQENLPDIIGMNGMFAALLISNIPLISKLGSVRVGYLDGKFLCNPNYEQIEKGILDLVIAATPSDIIMIEGSSKEVSNSLICDACAFAFDQIKIILSLQEELRKLCETEKLIIAPKSIDPNLEKFIKETVILEIKEAYKITEKLEREKKIDVSMKNCIEKFGQEKKQDILDIFKTLEKEEARDFIINEKKRIDGRSFTEIRPITCEIEVLAQTHGSALFTRGQTQALVVTTLGSSIDEQKIDDLESNVPKSFMLHYNFPPFSTGDVKPLRGPGRREIGHGSLAERAIKPIIPNKKDFPYTIRVVSDILESNGSSSMASVCGTTLSLMDAGVPITSPVTGVAMGLIKKGDEEIILSDISGLEDHIGDMDFKIAGTCKGITAIQLDLKISGIRLELIGKIIEQAEKDRYFILNKILEVIPEPKKNLSVFAPKIISFPIKKEKIGEVIGPSGKTIKRIIAETGVSIDIKDEDGMVFIFSQDAKAVQRAKEIIDILTQEIEVGTIYNGKVSRITNFGAFVEIGPGKEGLVHISQLSESHVKNVEDVVKIGDEIPVKVIEIDEIGRINLSRKQALRQKKNEEQEKQEKQIEG